MLAGLCLEYLLDAIGAQGGLPEYTCRLCLEPRGCLPGELAGCAWRTCRMRLEQRNSCGVRLEHWNTGIHWHALGIRGCTCKHPAGIWVEPARFHPDSWLEFHTWLAVVLVDHGCWPYFEYHAFQREIAQHADNWCSDWATLERLAKEENERQEAAGKFCWAFLARVPTEAVARWGCDIPDNMVALAGGNQGPVLFWESGRMAYGFLDD